MERRQLCRSVQNTAFYAFEHQFSKLSLVVKFLVPTGSLQVYKNFQREIQQIKKDVFNLPFSFSACMQSSVSRIPQTFASVISV